ncbi:aspartate aminotransferase, putative [Ixodes scapularis]|uniref:aspartate transaminase n=1 Tax=Ixodes scapularis TaxID=6945 RepID=B7QLB0_IXOSC|nr:aspartate aminotransferase, putative [Ixodes scapularis]|eukprot:XP_002415966.1 aspartate aminotransferase, putative [Ixodes scapularis]
MCGIFHNLAEHNKAEDVSKTEEAKPWVLPVVRKVEKEMAEDDSLNHEYLGQLGLEDFSKAAVRMLLGDDNDAIKDGRAVGIQCLSGTGSLRVAGDLLCKHAKFTTIYMSTPTWPNHTLVFKHSGFQNLKFYRYWDAKNRCLNFAGMIEDLENAPEDSVVVLHACAHNPTGIDPTEEQWKKIAEVVKARKLFPLFDCAYQGFASGNLEKDSWAIRYFVSQGFELLCAQSFAKNFGLYRPHPNHGKQDFRYEESPQRQACRIKYARILGTHHNQIGMFSYTGLNQRQVQHLVEEYHVYLPKDGRISLCGLNTGNVEYVAKAIHDAVTKFPTS